MENGTHRNISNISIRILEHIIEPVIGRETIDELRKPLKVKKTRLKLEKALELAEKGFIEESEDKKIAKGLLDLPISDSPSVIQAVLAFYDRPNKDSSLAKIILGQLKSDFQNYPSDLLEQAVYSFISFLILELVNVDKKFRSKVHTFEAIKTTNILNAIKTEYERINGKRIRKGNIPQLPNLETYVGRDGNLRDLKIRLGLENLMDKKRYNIIHGWPGVGKTTLVTFLVYEEDVEKNFVDGIFWASLGDRPNLYSIIFDWAQSVGVEDILRKGSENDGIRELCQFFKDKKALFIIDDVYKTEHAQPLKGIGGIGCTTIFTTRHNNVANELADNPSLDVYKLECLSDKESIDLLSRLAPDVCRKYPLEIKELAKNLQGLPLALQVAGRLLYRESKQPGGVSSSFFIDIQEGSRLVSQRPPSDRLLEIANETNPTVAALLKKTTDLLEPTIRDYFAFLGAFAPKPATFELEDMAELWSVGDPKPIVSVLYDFGLIEPLGDRYWMHSLLTMHANWLLDNP